MRRIVTGVLAGLALTLAGGASAYAQDKELTIFWAEWDPANYLQELVNDYEAETGVKVTVETTPWSDFQTKAFAEFNAHGDAYDMVVGDSQWLGAGATGGHYVDLLGQARELQRLGSVVQPRVVREIRFHAAAVDCELSGTGPEKHARNGFLAAPRAVKPGLAARCGRFNSTQCSSSSIPSNQTNPSGLVEIRAWLNSLLRHHLERNTHVRKNCWPTSGPPQKADPTNGRAAKKLYSATACGFWPA